MDPTEARWRRRPVLAGVIRAVVILTPLVAAVAAGVTASHLFRPVGWAQIAVWLVWTGGVSIFVLALVDAAVRRLLPLQRLLQLCLVFPDRAPSRLKVAVRAARPRRPEQLVASSRAPVDAAAAAAQIVELLAALAVHDRRTRGHSERVCAYTELIAAQMDLSPADHDRLMWVSLIHDIGKLNVPSRLLNKPGQPTVPEWQVLQAHPVHGDRIVAPLREWLGEWADAVVQHHERYDGHGYPHGLRGEQLCLGGRIIAVTDAFEVMTAPRAYRRPVDPQSARAELARHAGTQFDPHVVRQFLSIGLPQLRRSMGLLAWIGQIPFIRSWPQLQSAPAAAATQAATATVVATSAGAALFAPAVQTPALAAPSTAGAAVTHATATTAPTGSTPATMAATSTTVAHSTAGRPAARHTATRSVSRTATTQPASTTPAAPTAQTGSRSAGATTAAPAPTPSSSTNNGCASSHGRHLGWQRGHGQAKGRHEHGCS